MLMFERVKKRMRKTHTSNLRNMRKTDDNNEREVLKKEVIKVNKSLRRLHNDEKNGNHIDSILRGTDGGNDLVSLDKENSQNIMKMILFEDEFIDE